MVSFWPEVIFCGIRKYKSLIARLSGPAAVAHLLDKAVREASKVNLDLASLHVYVAVDCTIYSQDIFDNCYSIDQQTNTTDVPWKTNLPQKPLSTWKSLILLIPLRLGNEKLNPIYSDCLKAMLSLEWCIGIIGMHDNKYLNYF